MFDAIAGLAGAGLGYLSTRDTNAANARAVQMTNDANYRIFKEGNDFSERMANTAYQRGVADMRAAGINPMMAYSQGGAQAPTTTTARMEAPHYENAIGRGVSSAMDSIRIGRELKQSDSSIALQKAQEGAAETQQVANISSGQAARAQAHKADMEANSVMMENIKDQAALDDLKKAGKIQANTQLKTAIIDNKTATYDAVMSRANQALGTFNKAKDLIVPKINIGPSSPGGNTPSSPYIRNKDGKLDVDRSYKPNREERKFGFK